MNTQQRLRDAVSGLSTYWPRFNGIPPQKCEERLVGYRDEVLALIDANPIGELDAAWAEAEAALPDGWLLIELIRRGPDDKWDASWTATATAPKATGAVAAGWGNTPINALHDLAKYLRELKG